MNCSQQTKANIFVSYKVFVNIFVAMSVSPNSCELILMTPAVFFVCLFVFSAQFYLSQFLFSAKSQQQSSQGALYFKVKTLQ